MRRRRRPMPKGHPGWRTRPLKVPSDWKPDRSHVVYVVVRVAWLTPLVYQLSGARTEAGLRKTNNGLRCILGFRKRHLARLPQRIQDLPRLTHAEAKVEMEQPRWGVDE